MTVRVLHPGLLLTLQDLGRPGLGAVGVPPSGAADPLSLVVGNRLLGNVDGAPALEATLTGPSLAFDADATLALTGAPFAAQLTWRGIQSAVPHATPFPAPAGSTLRLQSAPSGVRAYVCVVGGFAATLTLGSASTQVGAGLGGLAGRALRAGDTLALGDPAGARAPRSLPAAARAWLAQRLSQDPLRVVPGPDAEAFPPMARDLLTQAEFRVLDRSDRSGVRLRGPDLSPPGGGAQASAPVPRGALEVPGPREAVLLLPDGPTTGGYPVLATVLLADQPRLGQLRPREALRFAWVDLAAARSLFDEEQRRLDGWLPCA